VTALDDAQKKGQTMAKNLENGLPSPAMFLRPGDTVLPAPVPLQATAVTPFFRVMDNGTLSKIEVVAGANVTLSSTSITFTRYRSGTGVVVKTVSSGTWTLGVATDLGSLSNTALEKDDILAISVTKSGAGLLLPPLTFFATISAS